MLQLDWFLPPFLVIAILFWPAYRSRQRHLPGSSKFSNKAHQVSWSSWSHDTSSPSTWLAASKASTDVQAFLVNARCEHRLQSGLHRRSSDTDICPNRTRQTPLCCRKPLQAAGRRSQVRKANIFSPARRRHGTVYLYTSPTIDSQHYKTELKTHFY